MSTIGSLVVELRANSAKFETEMTRARKTTKDLGKEFSQTRQLTTQFATQGLAALVPEVQGAEMWIGRLTQGALRAGPAMLLFGKALLGVGVAVAAYKAGGMLGRFLFGEDEAAKAMKDAQEMEKFWIISSGVHRREARARTVAEAAELAKRREEREKYDLSIVKSMNTEKIAQLQSWIDQATAYTDHLQKRTDARKAFEAKLGKGGLPGASTMSGVGAIRDLTAQLDEDMKGLAFLKDMGALKAGDEQRERENIRARFLAGVALMRVEYAAFPAVLDAIQVVADKVDFTNLGAQMDKGRQALEQVGITADGTNHSLSDFHDWLSQGIPSATQKANAELAQFNQWLVYTKQNLDAAKESAAEFAGATQ